MAAIKSERERRFVFAALRERLDDEARDDFLVMGKFGSWMREEWLAKHYTTMSRKNENRAG
jgi:hypothetical protein